MKRTLKWIALGLLLNTAGHAQQQTSHAWTIQECVDYAIRNNIQVKQSQLDVARASAFQRQARADLLPTVNASTSYSYNVGRSVNTFNNQIEEVPINTHSMGISGSLLLFNSQQKWNTIRQSNIERLATEYDVETTKNNVMLSVVSAYTQILFNRELLENAELTLTTTNLQVERTKTLVDVGLLALTSLLDLEAQLASDELAVINAQNQLELARLNLQQTLQLPENQEVEIVVPELDDPEDIIPPQNASEIYHTALANQPEIKAADARVRFQDYGVKIAKANRYPSLSLNGGISTNYSSIAPDEIPLAGAETIEIIPIVGYLGNDQNQPVFDTRAQNVPTEFTENTYYNQLNTNQRNFVSLNLNIPIFNGWQVRTNVSNQVIARENAKYLAIDARNRLRQTIEQAYLDVRAAAKSYEATRNQVEALEESFRSNEQRFELGAINAVDYNLVKNNLDGAKSDFIRAKYDFIFRSKILDFYLGNPISF